MYKQMSSLLNLYNLHPLYLYVHGMQHRDFNICNRGYRQHVIGPCVGLHDLSLWWLGVVHPVEDGPHT